MKKVVTLGLATLMVASLTACGGSSDADRTLNVAVGATLSGDFLPTDGFGNSTYDKDVRDLIHGYDLTYLNKDGVYEINKTVVDGDPTETVDDAGNTVMTFKLKSDLVWNDGEKITADDYIFAALLLPSPEVVAKECNSQFGEGILGYSAYHTGEVKEFAGIKKIDDTSFSITLDKEAMPYYWELSYIGIQPFPLHTLAKDGVITTTDGGSSLDKIEDAAAAFAADYRTKPMVTSGPYKFISFENNQVKLEINDKFVGNPDGKKPSIKSILIKTTDPKLDVETVKNKEADLVSRVKDGEKIEGAKTDDNLYFSETMINGIGSIVPLTNDFGPTKEKEVRHAIAYMIDKDSMIQELLGGYGSTVYSYYSKASLEYTQLKDKVESELTSYTYNIDSANKELDASSYRFEQDGVTPFDSTKASADYLRYNSAKEKLTINYLGSEGSKATDNLELQFQKNAPKVGMNFTIAKSDFSSMLTNYYQGSRIPEGERVYHMFSMGIGFADANDPYFASYACSFVGTDGNATGTCDPELDAAMVKLRGTDQTDQPAFAQNWLEFIKAWNDVLPSIPLYSGQQFDFATKDLEGLDTNATSYTTWAKNICDYTWK